MTTSRTAPEAGVATYVNHFYPLQVHERRKQFIECLRHVYPDLAV